jgi:hypothetical protein
MAKNRKVINAQFSGFYLILLGCFLFLESNLNLLLVHEASAGAMT